MKFFLFAVAIVGNTAFAAQTITCKQLNKSGSIKKNGVSLSMVAKKSGRVTMTGLSKDGTLDEQVVRSINEGVTNIGTDYTNFFIVPKYDDGMLDIQLQFDDKVLKKNFNGIKATYVIGSDSANTENYFSYGYDMICDGKL